MIGQRDEFGGNRQRNGIDSHPFDGCAGIATVRTEGRQYPSLERVLSDPLVL